MNRKGTAKLNFIKDIEILKQKKWEEEKIFEAIPDYSSDQKNKYFVSFPFPYMNGSLHLGHAFTLSKCEFAMGYQKLKGKNTLWGFGLHCTGMPIKSSADKLRREMETFGYPPNFPVTENVVKEEKSDVIVDKSKGKKSKAVAKSGGFKYQWQIMRNNGLSDEEIRNFVNTNHWIEYYSPLTIDHMKRMGIKVDWRRSFVTTDVNPFYDSFVRWQFLKLRKSNKVMFGKRQTIFSPIDNQPCMDHDRSSGEGVGPQDYTLIKMKLQKPYPKCLENITDTAIFLLAATLRPETMYGQTNCWVHPDVEYVAVKSDNHGVLVCVERSARNMSYQEILSPKQGEMKILSRFLGMELIGAAVKSALSSYDVIYTLPMLTIKQSKGTGIVTSVPSDSPDDFAALRDLKKKEAMRKKYGLADHQVLPFEPVAIISTPEYGNMCAVRCVEEMKIQSQNDTDKLLEAKEKCYKSGFYNGQMLVGEFAGSPVSQVKETLTRQLIASDDAIKYAEPERTVISRSGDECVVALCDQWFLNYRDAEWKSITKTCLDRLNTYGEEVRRNFEATLANLHEYACSRSFGLGTRLPWDEQYLVESLSDSTIYMAYYTVAHALQGDSLDGRSGINRAGLTPEDMTADAWEYLLGDRSADPHGDTELLSVPPTVKAKLDELRNEFLYWYPVDLRVSGKDLVPNHLTYYLYNHCAIWPNQPEQFWPVSIRANGHLLLNNEKMSKSTGNFLTVIDAIDKYSADGMRLAIADAGDSIEDANFDEAMADAALLRLHTFIDFVKEMLELKDRMRSGPITSDSRHCDRVFANSINRAIRDVDEQYRSMMYKRVVQLGFYEMLSARDRYREASLGDLHSGLIMHFIETLCLLLCPICPHITDYVWVDLLHKPQSILRQKWPMSAPVDEQLEREERYLDGIAHEFRKQGLVKPRGRPNDQPHNAAVIWIARQYPAWQRQVLEILDSMSSPEGTLPDNKLLNQRVAAIPELKPRVKKVMDFVQLIRVRCEGQPIGHVARLLGTPELDEKRIIERNIDYLERTLGLQFGRLEIRFIEEAVANDNQRLIDSCCPLEPKITFITAPVGTVTRSVYVVNESLFAGRLNHFVDICDGDSVVTVTRRLANLAVIEDFATVDLYYYTDLRVGMRSIPLARMNNTGAELLGDEAVMTRVESSAVFAVSGNRIELVTGTTRADIGEKIKYVVRA